MPQTHEIEHHPQQPTQLKRIEVVAAVIFDERADEDLIEECQGMLKQI